MTFSENQRRISRIQYMIGAVQRARATVRRVTDEYSLTNSWVEVDKATSDLIRTLEEMQGQKPISLGRRKRT